MTRGNYKGYSFTQGTTGIAVGANSTQQDSLIIENLDFLLKKISVISTGSCTLQFTDNRGRNWYDKPIRSDLFFTNAANNNRELVYPRMIRRKETVTVTVTDISGAANAVYIAFEGMELIPPKKM